MAKQKGRSGKGTPSKSKEEDYEFVMPDFDEEAFRRKEIAGAEASFVTFGFAIVVGIVARGLEILAGDWRAGVLAMVVGLGVLRPLLERAGFGVALEEGWRSMIGDLFLLLFTALAVWVLFSNPPFSTLF